MSQLIFHMITSKQEHCPNRPGHNLAGFPDSQVSEEVDFICLFLS